MALPPAASVTSVTSPGPTLGGDTVGVGTSDSKPNDVEVDFQVAGRGQGLLTSDQP